MQFSGLLRFWRCDHLKLALSCAGGVVLLRSPIIRVANPGPTLEKKNKDSDPIIQNQTGIDLIKFNLNLFHNIQSQLKIQCNCDISTLLNL